MNTKQYEFLSVCAAALIAACMCGCASKSPRAAAPPAASKQPPVLLPLPAEYPAETADWDTSAPVMICANSRSAANNTLRFVSAFVPALKKRGYTSLEAPLLESEWMAAATRSKAKLVIPRTFIMQASPAYQGQQTTDFCQQVLVVDVISGNPRIKTFHVWARQEHPTMKMNESALMSTLVENLMRMPAFRTALQQQQE